MIFQKLHGFAERQGLLDDLDFVGQNIHGRLLLKPGGEMADKPMRLGEKRAPRICSVAKLPARNGKAIAGVGADTISRIVPGFDPGANEFARQTQLLFLEQMEAINRAQPDPHAGLSAVIAFLRSLQESAMLGRTVGTALRRSKLLPIEWISFQVEDQEDGMLCVDWPVVRAWWRGQRAGQRAAGGVSGEGAAGCMGTGQPCQPQGAHGTRLKGIPAGRSGGVALVSGENTAFSSYGFERALTSPMGERAVEGYIRAIDFMVKDPAYHCRSGELIHFFFGDEPNQAANPGTAIRSGGWPMGSAATRQEHGNEDEVTRPPILGACGDSADTSEAERVPRFYSLSLSGSGARAIVRGWLDQPWPTTALHVQEWFEDLEVRLDRPLVNENEVIAPRGRFYRGWPLWRLVETMQGPGEDAKQQIVSEQQLLWECALAGRTRPMPLGLLTRALSRIGTTAGISPVRAALIRCVLNRLPGRTFFMQNDLNPQLESAAYQCGRLLRVLASVRRVAFGSAGVGVVEKHYLAASSMPGHTFGALITKAQPLLTKLARDPHHAWLAAWFKRELTEICATIVGLGGFPTANDPVQRGEFALGFYFQEARAPKQAAQSPTGADASEDASA